MLIRYIQEMMRGLPCTFKWIPNEKNWGDVQWQLQWTFLSLTHLLLISNIKVKTPWSKASFLWWETFHLSIKIKYNAGRLRYMQMSSEAPSLITQVKLKWSGQNFAFPYFNPGSVLKYKESTGKVILHVDLNKSRDLKVKCRKSHTRWDIWQLLFTDGWREARRKWLAPRCRTQPRYITKRTQP